MDESSALGLPSAESLSPMTGSLQEKPARTSGSSGRGGPDLENEKWPD
jgi:hypothetical protein